MATIDDAWRRVERWAKDGGSNDRCILDLRARVEALEQRATIKESLTVEPAPAPDDRPLWQVMREAYWSAGMDGAGFAAEIDAVADWLDCHGRHYSAAAALRTEARRAREGA